ncbi:MAG: hypothetical protein UW91_C0017G0002 [Parcubacteria group bacterium GW2011_GWF2_45_11]|nr:MAG: hypothetical protein UW91_C0017G0002 [Parcubacteria group bacterium GW2011_GWF2_45_11]KKT98473.1 MAG: hypothetical protein UW98_C0007G0002 [Parcubacteria group bacterium GW2011_GWC2_45_15]
MTKKEVKKIYRARLEGGRSKVVGWPKYSHIQTKKGFWQTVRALLF